MIKAAQPYFDRSSREKIQRDIDKVMATGVLIFGQFTERFEQSFATYQGKKYAVAVHSCSAALEIVLKYCGIEGKEVIVPTNTFVATAFAALKAGGKLILSDIEPEYYGLDMRTIEKAVSHRTKAVVVVHIGGYMAPWLPEIEQYCRQNSLVLIEDAAHAHGASFKGKRAGSFGLAGCFSFYPTKVMTSGVGGCIVTDDKNLAEYSKSLRHFGARKNLGDIAWDGSDWLMDEFRAVIAYYQLKALPKMLAKRRQIADWYRQELKEIPHLVVPTIKESEDPAYYRFFVKLSPNISKQKIIAKFRTEHNIKIGTLYDPPVHRQPYFSEKFKYSDRRFAGAEKALNSQLALPVHPQLKREDIQSIAAAFREALG